MTRKLSQKQKDTAASQRLYMKYGISLEEFNEMLAAQGNVCAICKRPPAGKRQHTDHDHKFDRVKVKRVRVGDMWVASATLPNGIEVASAVRNKAEAVAEVKSAIKRHSIRGIVCYQCNTGLRWFRDTPELLDAAAQYLRRFCEQFSS